MSEVKFFPGGSPQPALSLVTPDHDTIDGDGTASSPLRVIGGAVGSLDIAAGSHPSTHLGAAVRPTGAGSYAAAFADSLVDASAFGLVSKVSTGISELATRVQYAGELTLTTAEWDVVTGGLGGLTPDAPYYVSDAVGGQITDTPPVAPGSFVSRVGIALSATTMLILLSMPIGPHA